MIRIVVAINMKLSNEKWTVFTHISGLMIYCTQLPNLTSSTGSILGSKMTHQIIWCEFMQIDSIILCVFVP